MLQKFNGTSIAPSKAGARNGTPVQPHDTPNCPSLTFLRPATRRHPWAFLARVFENLVSIWTEAYVCHDCCRAVRILVVEGSTRNGLEPCTAEIVRALAAVGKSTVNLE
jgi:hypothetical protein